MTTPADVDALRSWHHDWRGLRVAVLGLGVTGFSVADTLVELGAEVLVITGASDDERARLLDVIGATLRVEPDAAAAAAHLADFDPELVVVSPGFAPTHPLVVAALEADVPVWGDVELAWRVRDKVTPVAEWVCITGTNGKTTTTQLAAAMLEAGGRRVAACGNVGVPVLDAVRFPDGFDVFVVELSSFQLRYTDSLSPWASVCLNLADDHLDWHGSADGYAAAKAKVYRDTKVACVYNRSDDATMRMVENAEVVDGCRAIGFGLGVPGPSDFGIVDEYLVDRAFLDDRGSRALELATIGDARAVGLGAPHMIANVLAAAALVRSLDVSPEAVREAIRSFAVDHHRVETIAEAHGITWVDDSKATNPHAAQASLAAFESVVWIVGGLLKGASLDEIVARHATRLRAVIVIGEERAEVLGSFARHAPGVTLIEVVAADTSEVMLEAVRLSASVAVSGDTVLMAPAAASFDQFESYADRGRRFTTAVRQILGGSQRDDEHPEDRPQR